MRKAKSEHHISEKSGLMLIGTLILMTIVIILSYVWETQHTFNISLNDISWAHITIHIVASFLIGIIAFFFIRLSETKRRKMVEILQEEKNRAQRYLDVAGVILVAIDAEQKVSLINKKGCEILGYKQDEVTGKNWFENFLPKQVRSEVNAIYKKLMSGEIEPVEYAENLVLTRSGNEKIIAWHNTLLKDEAGKIIGTLSSGEDINEQKKTLEEIDTLKKQLEFILGATKTGLDIIDSDFNIRYVDPEWQKSYGDYRGKKCYEYFMGRDRVCPGCGIIKALETKKIIVTEEILVKEGNRPIQVTTIPFQNEKGEWLVAEVNVDLTERKKAEESLRETTQTLEAVIKASPLPIVVLDRERIVKTWNPAAERTFGWGAQEVIGHQYPAIPKEKMDETDALFLRALESGLTEVKILQQRKDGSLIDVSISAASLRDSHGNINGVMAVITDITERKRAEAALRESEQKFKSIFDNAIDGIGILDLGKRKFSMCNKAFLQMLGYTQEEFKNIDIKDIHRKEDLPFIFDQFEYFIRGDVGIRYDIVFKKKGNGLLYADLSPSLIEIDGKKYITIICKDITERKKAEELLKESEKRFKDVVESAGEWIWEVNANGLYTYSSQVIEKVLGFKPEEVVGKKYFYDFFAPKVKDEFKKAAFEVFARKESFTRFVNPGIHKNGNRVILETSGVPILDEKGNLLGYRGADTDITERKQAEEALRTSEAQLSNAMKIAKLGYWEYDVVKDLFTFNDHFYSIFRTSAERVGGYTMSSARYAQLFVHPDDMAVVGIETRKAIETTDLHYSRQLEHRIIYADGETGYITVRFFIVKDSQGRTVKTFGANQDITERKRIEEALRDSEGKYRLLIENQGEGIAMADLEEKFIFTNPAAEKIFGVTKGGLVGRNFKEFTSPEQFNSIQEQTKRRFREEKGSYEIEIINAKGEKRFLLLTAAPWFDKDGKLTSTFGIFRDITERKQLQQQLIQTEKLAAVGTLAYGIAHEFNNILAGMLANAELGLITDDRKQIKKCFEIISDNSYRASSITRNLLAFSSNKEAKKELIDITEPLRSILAITRRELEKLNIEIVEKFKPVLKIYCDAGQLSEVFLNMVTNARDAMRAKGGKLTIQVEPVGENIQIIFEDTGCGIPEKLKGKIFEPFVTTKGALGGSEIPGTGLGLFLSYGIIDGYLGKIEVESEVGKGAKFTILIPVSKNLPPKAIKEIEIKPSIEIGRKLKILLVDDEKAISSGLKKFLESRGHQVTASLKAEEGLEHFEKEKFDLVLSDIAMPDMDGIELIKKIKEQDQKTKVIVITGHIMREMEEKAKEAGADEVLIKPFKNDVLCSAISKLIPE